MKHNHFAIIAAVAAAFIVGFIWYSPALFLESWARGWGKDPEAVEPASPATFLISLLGTFLGAYLMSWLIQCLGVRTGWGGAGLAFALWAGLIMPNLYTHYSFGGIGLGVAAIDSGNALAGGLVMGFILGVWQPRVAATG